ncbi:35598_t:CDS:2, partial [Racocetra persica]
ELQSEYNPLCFERWLLYKDRTLYPTDNFDPRKKDKNEDILKQRPIGRSTINLLDAAILSALLIERKNTTYHTRQQIKKDKILLELTDIHTYIENFLLNLNRLEKEFFIPIEIIRIIQASLVSIQLLSQNEGVTRKTSILLGEHSTETQLELSPKAIYDEYHYIIVKKIILQSEFQDHEDYIKTFYEELHINNLIQQIIQYYQTARNNLEESEKVYYTTTRIINLQEKLLKTTTKQSYYLETEFKKIKIKRLEEILLKELDYLFYNLLSEKLVKERKIIGTIDEYTWKTINNHEYNGYNNRLIAHNDNDYNSEENHRQYTIDLIDQYEQNGTNNKTIPRKQEYPHETFERIAEREALEETGILLFQEKLILIGHSYYPPKDTNGYNTTNATEIKTYIHPANNQEPIQMEPHNHGTWKYYTKAEILDRIITTPELQLQLNTIFYTIENYQTILDIQYRQEIDSENEEQFEKLKLPNLTLEGATEFVNRSFENIQREINNKLRNNNFP